MNLIKSSSILLLFILFLFLPSAYSQVEKQSNKTIDILEPSNINIKASKFKNGLVKLEFERNKKKSLTVYIGQSNKRSFAVNDTNYKYKLVTNKQSKFQILLIIGISSGIDHDYFEITPIGIYKGKIRRLVNAPFSTYDQGGAYLGDLGYSCNYGISIFEAIYSGNEGRSSDHKYLFKLYKLDRSKFRLIKCKSILTKMKYNYWGEATKELTIKYNSFLEQLREFEPFF